MRCWPRSCFSLAFLAARDWEDDWTVGAILHEAYHHAGAPGGVGPEGPRPASITGSAPSCAAAGDAGSPASGSVSFSKRGRG